MHRSRRATTIPELVAALTAVAILLALVLPALAGAQNDSREATSSANLRTIGAAHTVYAADWNGRQVTWIDDEIVSYGVGCDAFERYRDENGFLHPPLGLGWGREKPHDYRLYAYRTSHCVNAQATLPPIGFHSRFAYFGSFRLLNSTQFNQYVGGRFYDPIFHAPNDTVVVDAIDAGGCFDSPDGFCTTAEVCQTHGNNPAWSSYALSPAAMFDPAVMAHHDPDDPEFNGWQDPWSLPTGFRSPALTAAAYPSLKTHVLEHHWLQNNPGEECNPGFSGGAYWHEDDCCEPYYFNHAWESSPATLFYDGHIGQVSVFDAVADDEQVREQSTYWGLWSKDTPLGDDGYLSQYGYSPDVETSFHVLTTDGIRGRDVLQHGAPRPRPERVSGFSKRPEPRDRPLVEGLRWLGE